MEREMSTPPQLVEAMGNYMRFLRAEHAKTPRLKCAVCR